jgi:tetratricopeptide (TPR) repeat protein
MAVDPAARRRALSTVGIMAFGRRDYAKAEAAQRRLVREAKAAREPVETAIALYNLGNTLIAAERAEEAVEVLSHAADGCSHHATDELAPLVFTNLGVALYRTGAHDAAYLSLKVARDMFRAQRNLPAEAHVYDCLATLDLERGRRPEAERAWRYALDRYDGIANPALHDVKTRGRTEILRKLERIGGADGD